MTGGRTRGLRQIDHLVARIAAEQSIRAQHRDRAVDRRASGTQLRVIDHDEPHAELLA